MLAGVIASVVADSYLAHLQALVNQRRRDEELRRAREAALLAVEQERKARNVPSTV